MCIRPNRLPNGVEVACRKCWQCIENRVNDWVGRCIAETETARAASSITLTYGRDADGKEDHERAAVLTYSDVQKYVKLLRRHGYPCRYFAVGEYGSTKGRAHWHVMLFWQGPVPPHTTEERFLERHWPHGWSYWEQPTPAAIRYVCKYIMKDMGQEERQGHLAMSKKPPLGAAYFEQLAARYVVQGLAPQEPYYSFGHVRDKNDRPVRFYLSGASLDLFCRAYLDQWAKVHKGHHPYSPVIEEYEDRQAQLVQELRIEPFKPVHSKPWIKPPNGELVQFSEPLNTWYYDTETERLYWSFDSEGDRAWRRNLVVEPKGGPPLTSGAERYLAATSAKPIRGRDTNSDRPTSRNSTGPIDQMLIKREAAKPLRHKPKWPLKDR